jgi:dolichol-phosphate mannosyltransferase
VQAFQRGLADGYDVFFEMDTDLSHDPRYLPDFLEAIERGADVVIGSRNIPGGGVEGWGLGRHVLSKGGSLYSRTILGLRVRDLTSGYKAFRRRVLEAVDLERIRSEGYSFQIELTFRAIRRGFTVAEVPIVFVDRRVGQSKMSRRIYAEAVGVVWKLRLDALLERL